LASSDSLVLLLTSGTSAQQLDLVVLLIAFDFHFQRLLFVVVAPQLTVVMLPLPFPVVVSAWVDVLGVWVQPKGAGGP
jgi:hypothetical protein